MSAASMPVPAGVPAVPSGARVSRRRLVWEGARDMTPMVLGVVPFAVAVGAAVSTSSLTTAQGLASGPVILAGSAQLAAVEMLDLGTAAVVVIVSALVINARIILYSTALAPWFREQSLGRRLLLAVPVIDQMHFLVTPRFQKGDLDASGRVAYYAGAGTWLVSAWLGTQALAIVVGARLPDSVGLELAAPLVMAGLLAKSTVSRPTVVAALVAGVLAVVGAGLPMHTSMLVATLVGIAAGRVVPARTEAHR
jgi:predicted branched-subunit amino acid permease